MDHKICVKCNLEKHLSEFHQRGKGLRRTDCRQCVRLYGTVYRDKNKELIQKKKREYHRQKPEIKRNSYLKLTYGMTEDDYARKCIEQDYVCAICKTKEVNNIQHRHFYIDHCHKSGKIRGILCHHCNSGIGHFKDDLSLLKSAINYLHVYQIQEQERG